MGVKFRARLELGGKTATGIAAGNTVEVELALDTEPRVLAVPPDLAQALARDPAAKKGFEGLSYSKKQRFTIPIEQAKTAETRQRNVDKAITASREGRI